MAQKAEMIDHRDNPHRIVREKERFAITGIARSPWYRLEEAGEAPKRIPLSRTGKGKTHGWTYGELIEWIESRKAARGAA